MYEVKFDTVTEFTNDLIVRVPFRISYYRNNYKNDDDVAERVNVSYCFVGRRASHHAMTKICPQNLGKIDFHSIIFSAYEQRNTTILI